MTTATFSNGYTDTYKGTRPVRAAWAIIRKADGKVLASGHSLDRAKAAKTSEGNFSQVAHAALGRSLNGISCRPGTRSLNPTYFAGLARKQGFDSWKAAYAAYQADAALAREAVTIEIIDL